MRIASPYRNESSYMYLLWPYEKFNSEQNLTSLISKSASWNKCNWRQGTRPAAVILGSLSCMMYYVCTVQVYISRSVCVMHIRFPAKCTTYTAD